MEITYNVQVINDGAIIEVTGLTAAQATQAQAVLKLVQRGAAYLTYQANAPDSTPGQDCPNNAQTANWPVELGL